VDLKGDGHNEVLAVPNVEKNVPYVTTYVTQAVTQAYAVMALQAAYADGAESAMRLDGFETHCSGANCLLWPTSRGGRFCSGWLVISVLTWWTAPLKTSFSKGWRFRLRPRVS
jgi:hypothetical protein